MPTPSSCPLAIDLVIAGVPTGNPELPAPDSLDVSPVELADSSPPPQALDPRGTAHANPENRPHVTNPLGHSGDAVRSHAHLRVVGQGQKGRIGVKVKARGGVGAVFLPRLHPSTRLQASHRVHMRSWPWCQMPPTLSSTSGRSAIEQARRRPCRPWPPLGDGGGPDPQGRREPRRAGTRRGLGGEFRESCGFSATEHANRRLICGVTR